MLLLLLCVCVCGLVGTLWAALRGSQSHSANGAAGTASESIRPHYSSCSPTILLFFLSSPLSSPHPNPSFLSFSTRPCSQPRVARNCPGLLAGIYITPPERGAITAGSSHVDWLGTHADSDTKGNIVEEETRRGVGVYPSGRNWGLKGLAWRDTKANSWPKVYFWVCVCACVWKCHKLPSQVSLVFTVTVKRR